MSKTNYTGIDYGLGRSNINKETRLRFGVISQDTVGQAWYEDAEADYGEPHCPKCGRELKEPEDRHVCEHCGHEIRWVGDECYGDEPLGFSFEDDKYTLVSCLDFDIMVLKSPYYTYAQFCSPCVPGACNLNSPLTEPSENNRCYCLGPEWFEDHKAPYPVYSVKTKMLVDNTPKV